MRNYSDMLRRYLDAVYYTMDGNFRHTTRRSKPKDVHDYSLYGDTAYFANEEDLRIHMAHARPDDTDVSQ